ncbi:uncharacterized protein LOC134260170 [Saccostrea cucullata]|uniref:uncharacterized protein LOC134260170 n=1 Tax=Saccostrea cuccullata TaxID=36930 RepID=UPI002ED40B8E
MKRLSCFSFVVISLFGSALFSVLTDGNIKNSTDLDFGSLDTKHVDVLRQLLNQETLIRMTLVKNVHALMKDMVSLQQSLVSSESEMSSLKDTTTREITELKKEVRSLKLEKNRLSSKVTRYNENIESLKENLTVVDASRRVFETQLLQEKEMFEQNTSGIFRH